MLSVIINYFWFDILNEYLIWFYLNRFGLIRFDLIWYDMIFTGCQNPITVYSVINPSAVSYGATGQPQITNRTDCENLCTNDASCVSYQLDDNDFRSAYCWLQKSLTSAGLNDTNNLYPRGRVTEWAKTTTCSTPGNTVNSPWVSWPPLVLQYQLVEHIRNSVDRGYHLTCYHNIIHWTTCSTPG